MDDKGAQGAEARSPGVVLVLEDELLIALDLEATLHEKGFSVTIFSVCHEAMAWLGCVRPDFAILDVALSDGSSEAVAQRLEKLGVPIVIHSGYTSEKRSLPDIFLRHPIVQKPADISDILALLT